MHGCLTLAQLEAAARASDADRAPHVATCDRCRQAVDRLREDRRLLDELRTATSPTSPPDPLLGVPSSIESYRILHQVHGGPAGTVYRAESEHGTPVALKILRDAPRAATRIRWRFEREIELASQLDHPSIVPVLDHGTTGEHRWYAMPWIDGEHLHGGTRTPREKVALFHRVCQAVCHAHERGVVHRDLKPSNILIDERGAPHVLDFGVARQTENSRHGTRARATCTGDFVGTLAYAAPEQLRRPHGASVPTTDVYALGVILHELLTGDLPYEITDDLESSIHSITSRTPRLAHPAIDHGLRAVLARTLAKDPDVRYPSAGTLGADLEHYLRGDAVRAPGVPLHYRARKALRRHAATILVTSAVCAVIAVAVGLAISQYWIAERNHDDARQVQSLLRDLLAAAGPDGMGADAPLLEVLEQAADRIEDTLEDAPDLRAAVQFTIGDTYRRLLIDDRAVHHLEAALDRYRQIGPAAELDVARTLCALGLVHTRRNAHDTVSNQRTALAIRERRLGGDADDVARSRRALAFALLHAPEDPAPRTEARSLLDSALDTFKRHALPAEAGRTWHRMAAFHQRSGDPGAARIAYERALSLLEGPATPPTWRVECHSDFAGLLANDRDLEAATRQLDQASQLVTAAFGDARTTNLLRRFARLHFLQGEWQASERMTLHALRHELRAAAQRRIHSEPDITEVISVLETGPSAARYADALIAAFRVLREYHGAGAYEMAQWANGVAALMEQTGRVELSERLLREGLHYRCRVFGADCPHRGVALERLADLLQRRDATEEARVALREAADIALARDDLQVHAHLNRRIAELAPEEPKSR